MDFEVYQKVYRVFGDYNIFNRKGLSRELSLVYEMESNPPWVHFNCPSNDDLSFRVHDLEFGGKEYIFWHLSALDGREANFEGFTSPLSFLGNKKIRGYLGTSDFKHRTGIVVNEGRVEIVRPWEDRMEAFFSFIWPSMEMVRLRSKLTNQQL